MFFPGSAIVDMPRDRFRSPPLNPTVSIVEYVPKTEMDYGSLLCWATNRFAHYAEKSALENLHAITF